MRDLSVVLADDQTRLTARILWEDLLRDLLDLGCATVDGDGLFRAGRVACFGIFVTWSGCAGKVTIGFMRVRRRP